MKLAVFGVQVAALLIESFSAWRRRQKTGVRSQESEDRREMLDAPPKGSPQSSEILEKSFTAENADFAEKAAKSTDFEGCLASPDESGRESCR